MTDIFREVDDEVRAQRLAAFWKRYGTLVVSLAVLIVIGVAGWRFYLYRQGVEAAAQSERFQAALQLARDARTANGQVVQSKAKEAEAAFAAIEKDASGGYVLLSRFRVAAEQAIEDKAAGARAFDAIAEDTSVDPLLRDLARVRAALCLVDTASLDDLKTRIGALAEAGKPWRANAREILGLAAFRAGDLKLASDYFGKIALDSESPEPLRQRAQIMMGLVRGGTVPVR